MAEVKPLKLTDMGNGVGKLEEFADGDTLPAGLAPSSGTVDTTPVAQLAYPVSASTAVTGYEASKLNSAPVRLLGSAITGGWLAALGATAPYIDVALPFGVVIGDSIAEGHPALHGRLHPDGASGYSPDYASQAGQPNYELSRLTGSHWYNHGIGSQTTTQVLARFDRDAIGLVSDPGDGIGNKTLPGKPYVCLVIAGANDIAGGVSAETIQANMQSMLDKLLDADIVPVFATVAPSSDYTTSQRTAAQSINQWMLSTLASAGAIVFDLYAWGSDGGTGVKADRYVDTIHPSHAGYAQLAVDVFAAIPKSVCSGTLRLDFKVDPAAPPSSWAAPTKVRIYRENVSLEGVVSGDWIIFSLAALPALQSPVVRITLVSPASGNSGVSGASVGLMPTRPAPSSAGAGVGLAVAATLGKTSEGVWEFSASFVQRGVYSISAAASEVTITCDPVAMIMCGNVGRAAPTNNIKVSASWGLQPVTSFKLLFGDGATALDPTTSAVPNGTYYSLIGPAA